MPWLSAVVPALMTYVAENKVRDSVLLGRVMDWVNGKLAGAPPQAVLLSRVQKRSAGMKLRPFRLKDRQER